MLSDWQNFLRCSARTPSAIQQLSHMKTHERPAGGRLERILCVKTEKSRTVVLRL